MSSNAQNTYSRCTALPAGAHARQQGSAVPSVPQGYGSTSRNTHAFHGLGTAIGDSTLSSPGIRRQWAVHQCSHPVHPAWVSGQQCRHPTGSQLPPHSHSCRSFIKKAFFHAPFYNAWYLRLPCGTCGTFPQGFRSSRQRRGNPFGAGTCNQRTRNVAMGKTKSIQQGH